MKTNPDSDLSRESLDFCWYRWGPHSISLDFELISTLRARSLAGTQVMFAAGFVLSAVEDLQVSDLTNSKKFRPIKLSGGELVELRLDAGLPRELGLIRIYCRFLQEKILLIGLALSLKKVVGTRTEIRYSQNLEIARAMERLRVARQENFAQCLELRIKNE